MIIVGAAAYVALVLMLRVSGKRTLSKMNAFDLVVTVALGSTLATVLLSRSVPLADGLLAFGLLILLQYVITWLSVRSGSFQDLIKAAPTDLVRDGQYLEKSMRETARDSGRDRSRTQTAWHCPLWATQKSVTLETDGSLSVVPKSG